MRARIAITATAAALVVFACSDLKRAEEETPAPGDDGGTSNTDGGPINGGDATTDGPPGELDAGPPPPDFECGGDEWIKTTKTKKECEPRRTFVVDLDPRPGIVNVSITRTNAGRIGIAFHAPEFIDQGDMRLVHFTPTTPTFTPAMVVRPGSLGTQAGYDVKLAASGPDTIHVLAHDVDDSTSGDVVQVKLVAGVTPLTDPELVIAGVERETEMSFAVDAAGNAYAAVRITTGNADGGGKIAKVVGRRKMGAGAFTAMQDVATDLTVASTPGVGASSLFIDGNGAANVLFHDCTDAFKSTPRYRLFDGSIWSTRKTVDGANDGFAGFSPRLAVSGGRKIAAYFRRKGTEADLRVASWTLASDTPAIEIVDQSIPSADASAPRYRVAMAVDKYGLIHLAVVRPTNAQIGTLEYVRQTRDANGTTKWLTDTIDSDVLGDGEDASVDMVVDSAARPHIAYRSAKDLKVRYATRYDR